MDLEIPQTIAPHGRGEKVISALDVVDRLAGLYLGSENGSVDSWKEHFSLPGWAYANSESEAAMGKYPSSRRFRDHEKDRDVTVRRHLACRGFSAGLQIFFDQGGEGEPFIIAHIGEHLPYVTSRS